MRQDNACEHILLCKYQTQSSPSFSHSSLHLYVLVPTCSSPSFTINLEKVRVAIFSSVSNFAHYLIQSWFSAIQGREGGRQTGKDVAGRVKNRQTNVQEALTKVGDLKASRAELRLEAKVQVKDKGYFSQQ